MPLLTEASAPGAITGIVSAAPGWRVDAYAPQDTPVSAVPTPTHVVAWVLVADDDAAGGATVEPVFMAGERTWTPDQFRAVYGQALTLQVSPA